MLMHKDIIFRVIILFLLYVSWTFVHLVNSMEIHFIISLKVILASTYTVCIRESVYFKWLFFKCLSRNAFT